MEGLIPYTINTEYENDHHIIRDLNGSVFQVVKGRSSARTVVQFDNGITIEIYQSGRKKLFYYYNQGQEYLECWEALEDLIDSGLLPECVQKTIFFNLDVFRRI